MNTKVVFLILSLVIVASCSWFGNNEIPAPAGISTDSTAYEQYASCVTSCNTCETDCLDQTYYEKAVSEENKNVCDNIASPTLKQECTSMLLNTEAISELNKDKCMKLNADEQQSCLVQVSAEIALQSNSIEKCSESPDMQRCQEIYYMDKAINENDTSYCDSLSEEKKSNCYTILQQ